MPADAGSQIGFAGGEAEENGFGVGFILGFDDIRDRPGFAHVIMGVLHFPNLHCRAERFSLGQGAAITIGC